MCDGYTYYAIIDEKYPIHNPRGIIRRRMVNNFPFDEAFTRDLSWKPSLLLHDIQNGRSYNDFEEITVEQVDVFMKRISKKVQQEFIAQKTEGISKDESS